MSEHVGIGLLGFGTVGSSVYKIIEKHRGLITQKIGADLSVTLALVKDLNKKREGIEQNLLTQSLEQVIDDPRVHVVVEVMGDHPEALEAIKGALDRKKPVVTANKALIARHGPELFELAQKNSTEIFFEASVAGGVPLLRSLREGLAANEIVSLHGIINGTSNFILSKMKSEQADFSTVLSEAQRLGYAEADPSSDVEGHDAAYKLCILALLCHGQIVRVDEVFCRGISFLKPLDFEMAQKFGYVIKHLGITKRDGDVIEARVHPTMVRKTNSLAHVPGAFNAVKYTGDFVGEGMLYGLGAGGGPTASAVVGDVIEAARLVLAKSESRLDPAGFSTQCLQPAKLKDILDLESLYYIRFSVHDRPNVLSKITTVLGKYDISVQHLYQHGAEEDAVIPVIVFTHMAVEKNIREALKEIDSMDVVTETTKIIRIEDE